MFHPSRIKDEIYSVAEDYCCGSNTYRRGVIGAITDFFEINYPHIQTEWYNYGDGDCGIFYISWIENGMLQSEAFEWRL